MNAIQHPSLQALGLDHGFGTRGAAEISGLRRPRQVHGAVVATADQCRSDPPECPADAVVSRLPATPVGVVTADCVAILLAGPAGQAVAAIHAGWRGLALGVVEAGVDALRHECVRAGLESDAAGFTAVIGPHIGACCYEVDAPVLGPLRLRYGGRVADATQACRPGHSMLNLGMLVSHALLAAGLDRAGVASLEGACTCCDAGRFHSYRRDGARSGRLVHYIAARPKEA